MAADDKESDEGHQSRSLERDRGKRRRRHRSASPSPPKRRRKRSRSPRAEEKHRHKNSAEKHEDSKGHELSNRNSEGMSEEDHGREVGRKNSVEDDDRGGARKSSKEDRKVELHSSGDSSEDAFSESESDKGKKKKSRSKNHRSRKSKSKHHHHLLSELVQDESQTEGTSGESSEDSEDKYRRAKRRKRLKHKEKVERERRRRKKEKKRKMKEKEREHEKRKEMEEKVEKRSKGSITYDVGDCLEGDNMHGAGSNVDPILDPKHKIFLSHSGAQKEFVDHLCKALEDRCHYAFFDRRHESLPKGERFAGLIIEAIEQCEMLIVVVSNEYFMSKWPMIELSTFVKAHELHRGSNIVSKILPLFYGLSASDLDNEGMQKKWFKKWKTFAKADPKKRIVVSDWKNALDVLKSFNGLAYDRISKEVVSYEERIVSHVCKSISPDIKWDDSHVQGKSNICKVIVEKIEGIGVSQKYQVKVIGVYGVGGIGKTTICKTLCNELSSKFEGRVCHIEFPSVSKELFQKVVRDLTRKRMEVNQPLNEGECKGILCKSLFKERTFLAIDNISDNWQSMEDARTFLGVGYHPESLVVVIARSRDVLELLGLDRDVCLEMPDLGESDAMSLFLHHAIGGRRIFGAKEKHDIMTCVSRCYFWKGNGEGHHYHPLALKALGIQVSCLGQYPCDWVKNLPQVKNFNLFPTENLVFGILRSGFDLLPKETQTLFMDIACFCEYKIETWLFALHKQDEILAGEVELLQRKGLLQDVDLNSRRISMHDLYTEFGELEAKGSFNESTTLRERMWMYMEDGDLTKLEGGCWPNLIRLKIAFQTKLGQSMNGWRWDHFPKVEALSLYKVDWGHGTLNLESLSRLKVLSLYSLIDLDRVEGLENLKHLTYFEWGSFLWDFHIAHLVGKLPLSLRVLKIRGVIGFVVLGPNILAQCHHLSELEFNGVEAFSLDLSECQSLERVSIGSVKNLKTLSGLDACPRSNLHFFEVVQCEDLVDILGIDHLIGLKELCIEDCRNWEVPSLLALSPLTKLQVLSILGWQKLAVTPKDCFLCQLQKLRWQLSQCSEGLNLLGFKQSDVLEMNYNDGFKYFIKVGDYPIE